MVSNLRPALPTLDPRSLSGKTVLYTAAHGGFDLTRVPLGGAAAICSLLTQEWQRQNPFSLQVLSPEILGERSPKDKDLVHYSELRYARFCQAFEQRTTAEILRHDPHDTVVLSNDISEGPSFRLLAEKGYRIFTLFHVDVVDYVAALYLRGWARPETLTAFYEKIQQSRWRGWVPSLLKLVFQKQRDSVFYSRGLIVPAEGMKRVLLRCYPGASADRIHVVPWGTQEPTVAEADVQRRAAELRRQYGIPEASRVLLTLSRISPEKGQDRLLEALALWEQEPALQAGDVWAILCGEAAYMKGFAFQKRLKKLARKLKKVRILFPGYLAGLEKQAHFRLADLYVFPSRHESYGLTLLEAYRAGLPALACHHYGAEELLRPEFGELLPAADESAVPRLLQRALARLLADPARLKEMGQRAQSFAQSRHFSQTAQRLAEIVLT